MSELAGGEITDLARLAEAEAACRRCDLYRHATQAVPGQGAPNAPLMLVGEQPGDQEDLSGLPFVGPAGKLLDRALRDAGIDRGATFVTNAVKHFKHEPRGKRRIHKKPDAGEIQQCRWWLDIERTLVKPKLTVALGATAARALLGKTVTISRTRGEPLSLPDGDAGMITIHPSALLRLADKSAKETEYRRFVDDLKLASEILAAA